MILKKLELQGFKSFSDQTRLLFHPGITAIIGPNGTGKSNIVDALLWSLRGSRKKTFRGDRGEDVIFNGNSQKAPMGLADVGLTIGDENSTKSEGLIINHRFFRSGENEYRLNGKLVRLKDIQDTLWKNAIGETDYFVIEQGNIDVFLSSKPLEKRLLIEEAAGTSFYKEKKRQAQNKLESSEQNLVRLEDIIIEVEKAKNSLKRQASAAIRYRKLRESIRELTLLFYRKKAEQLEKNHNETILAYRQNLDKENALASRLKEEEKNLAVKRKEAWNCEQSLKEEQKSLFLLNSNQSRMEAEKDREEKRIDLLQETQLKALQNRDEFKQELEALESELSKAHQNLSNLTNQLQQKQAELESVKKATLISKQDLESNQKRIERLREEYFQKISEKADIKNSAAQAEKEIDLLKRQEEKLHAELKSQKSLCSEKDRKWKEKRDKLKNLHSLLQQKQEEVNEKQKLFVKTSETLQGLQDQIAELTKKREGATHHLNALITLKEKSLAAGLSPAPSEALGLFADMTECDPEYAPLVDVFYKEEAKAQIIHARDFSRLLEKTNIKGRFFLLHPEEKEKPLAEALDDPRVRGFLKSHIESDQKLQNHFSFLSEAAIVEDLKSAVELWLKHPLINYITLSGDVLLSSGLLTAESKGQGFFSLNQEIKKIEKEIESTDEKISPLHNQISQQIKIKQRYESEVQAESEALSLVEKDIETLKKEIQYDQEEKEKIQTHVQLIEKELSNLAAEKQQTEKRLHSLTKNVDALQQEEISLKTNLQNKEDALTSFQNKEDQRRKEFFLLQSSVDLTAEKINSLKRRIQEMKNRSQSLNKKLESIDTEIQEMNSKKDQWHTNTQQWNLELKKMEAEKQKKQAECSQNESLFREMQEELQAFEERINKRRAQHEMAKDERVKWEVRKAENDRDLVNLEESCWQEVKKTLKEVKEAVSPESIRISNPEESLEEKKQELQKYSAVNLMAEEEYLSQKERYDFLTGQRNDLIDSITSTKEAIKRIDEESKAQFLRALTSVNKNFQEVFSTLFQGGTAQLKLSDEHNPLESGIEIIAQPPGKRVKSLTLLSGGEKCLTSLSFFFALFHYKPAPFCILDEVDAALDEVNLDRFLNLMKQLKHHTQFIIITHNFKTMEVADYIYGTTMAEPNITSVYSVKIKNKQAVKNG